MIGSNLEECKMVCILLIVIIILLYICKMMKMIYLFVIQLENGLVVMIINSREVVHVKKIVKEIIVDWHIEKKFRYQIKNMQEIYVINLIKILLVV